MAATQPSPTPRRCWGTISCTTPWPIRRSRRGCARWNRARSFANPEIGDTIPRLCLDGSNRQPKFILPTLADALRHDFPIDGLAQEVAFWCRYCERTDEAGNEIAPNDDNSDALREFALASRKDPLAFLSNRTVFGPLADNPRFQEAFTRKLKLVQEQGVAAAIKAYLG